MSERPFNSYLIAGSLSAVFLFAAGILQPSAADNATLPGEVSAPYPTITNLAVEWLIKGDDNNNGVVTVRYRMLGEEKWHAAMPLVRVPAGNTGDRTRPCYRWDNKHSGSIFDLKPDTEYEIYLKLTDPDGGQAEKTVRAKTRPVPRPAPDGVVKKVNPRTFADAALTAQPGDIFLLSPGYYEEFTLQRDGAPGRPIVIRSDKAHQVINSTFDRVNLEFRKHVILEGVTVNGPVELLFAEDIAVRACTVNSKYGIIAKSQPGCKNCYIADNVVTYVMPWVSLGMGSGMKDYGGAACVGEGIEITGPGNVVCYNRVSGYRDCISTMEDLWVYDQTCIDIYNNDIYVGDDDAIEADFCMSNCRIMRNRITNCYIALSSQPGLGGPIYFIRNVMYNIVHSSFKLERYSVGNLFLHNTVVKVGGGFRAVHGPGNYFRTVFENNLTLGGPGGGFYGRYSAGNGEAVYLPGYNSSCEFDYNGVGTYQTPFDGQVGDKTFTDLEGLRMLTGGKHSVRVDIGVFKEQIEFPNPPIPERKPTDLSLKPGSAAVDAGLVIPNVNDNYTGKAPDLGAYELGQELPHYGPRPAGVDEETMWQETHR
ncbi:MAG TPA: right-handed parallel beta-helix repeat-containing protein [archaeon]|nr:right-handed parallel beta-helix repeat-containing protein [archaeon]